MKIKEYKFFVIEIPIPPDEMPEDVVYVCKTYEQAILKCPCGCGVIMYLNLIQEIRPRWIITGNSISPSIRRIIGCESHFSITNGKVITYA